VTLAKTPANVYWDSCAWIGLIMEEPEKIGACRYVIDEAKNGNILIWTSALSIAEVYKAKCPSAIGIPTERDAAFQEYVLESYVEVIQVTRDVATLARSLLRKFGPPLKKPADAIHLASAVLNNIIEFHTYDRDDLIRLDNLVETRSGAPIHICTVPEPPPRLIEEDSGSPPSLWEGGSEFAGTD
jgi:predicted nucleic acid-binding protein